jgi:hypothetical protein
MPARAPFPWQPALSPHGHFADGQTGWSAHQRHEIPEALCNKPTTPHTMPHPPYPPSPGPHRPLPSLHHQPRPLHTPPSSGSASGPGPNFDNISAGSPAPPRPSAPGARRLWRPGASPVSRGPAPGPRTPLVMSAGSRWPWPPSPPRAPPGRRPAPSAGQATE